MNVPHIRQISESHCGAAVLEILLEILGEEFSQEEITAAADAEQSIEEHGLRIDQLALASSRLAPHLQFWYKYKSTLDDLRVVIDRGYGVGVEWQGLFYESEEDEKEDGDYGHYSIVSHIDENKKMIIIVDPYKEFVHQDRIFPIDFFLRRWWDTNEIYDPVSGRTRIVEDVRLMFFVTFDNEEFPDHHGFKRYSRLDTEDDPYDGL